MPKKTNYPLSFLWRGKYGSTFPQKSHSGSAFPSVKLYTTISQLTLDRFIKCLCDKDLNQLIEQGAPDQKLLELVWADVHEQFVDGMKDKEGAYKIKLLAEINRLQFNYELINLCVKFLSVGYDKDVVEALRKHVRCGDFNPEDQQSYFKTLQIIINRAQKLQVDIEYKKAEYAALNTGETGGEGFTRKHFDRLISQVSIFAKFHIDKKVVMVSEFIEYYISMRESYEAIKKENDKLNAR